MSRLWLNGYGCTSAAGQGVQALWSSLCAGIDHSAPLITHHWPVSPLHSVLAPRACRWERASGETGTAKTEILRQLHFAWLEAKASLNAASLESWNEKRTGVIFASTKGFVDDVIWKENPSLDLLTPILNEFCLRAELSPKLSLTVSNACTSSLSALWLAEAWLTQNQVDQVVVIAADVVGPFVHQGFQTLQALSNSTVRPFSAGRDGLQLGEAAVVLLLSLEKLSNLSFAISGVGIDGEGYAVTRPSPLGDSVVRAIRMAEGGKASRPDLIIAHGTGTQLNDSVEDQVFNELYPVSSGQAPMITASKWSVGHCLGASGAIDIVLACQAMAQQKYFKIANSKELDPSFKGRYAIGEGELKLDRPINRVLVTSLGFGGIHAAAFVESEIAQ